MAGSPSHGDAALWYRVLTSDVAKALGKWGATALVAGMSAAFGFGVTWRSFQADLHALQADVVKVEAAQADQQTAIKALEQRQNGDDVLHAGEAEIRRQILQQLKEIRSDVQYLQRDLIGRVRQEPRP